VPVRGEGVVGGFSFRLNGKMYAADKCTRLYRAVEPEEMVTRILLLTRDGRFAYLDRVIGGKGIQAAEDWSADRAMRFLIQHGEGDLVDEFPDIFRKRAPTLSPRPKDRRIAAAPKGRPAEPYLFPLL
jgi:hypothetical protein